MEGAINISDYQYNLPDERIAKYPLANRDQSKLLLYKDGQISEEQFTNISNFIPSQSLLVVNNTKVIRARLNFKKATGAHIEIFCLEPSSPSDYYQSFQTVGSCEWICLAGNLKKWKEGKIFLEIPESKIIISAEKVRSLQEGLIIRFEWNKNITFADLLEKAGNIPIPPYLNRESENIDQERYQTVYALPEGSVAAPTAGLHFSDNVFEKLKQKEINTSLITLHVGAGTFKPVKSENALEHPMHTERFVFTQENIEQFLKYQNNITAVGTTSLRALESIFWVGVKLYLKKDDPFNIFQFEAYDFNDIPKTEIVLNTLLDYFLKNKCKHIEAATSIMIFPGYKFQMVNRLITNFHQPQSTLLLLVDAFVGKEQWKQIYEHALVHNFRFLSYGDSSLLFRKNC